MGLTDQERGHLDMPASDVGLAKTQSAGKTRGRSGWKDIGIIVDGRFLSLREDSESAGTPPLTGAQQNYIRSSPEHYQIAERFIGHNEEGFRKLQALSRISCR
jgi:hypothetical protein